MHTHNRTHCQSLVDRGANRGVINEGVTFINKSTHIHVNIRGIDNHEITSVSISTIDALDHSQTGPVIVIMHQYAYSGKGKTIYSYV